MPPPKQWLRFAPLAAAATTVLVQFMHLATVDQGLAADNLARASLHARLVSALAPDESRALQAQLETAWGECRPAYPAERRRQLAEIVLRESLRQGFDPLFVQALIEVESTCQPRARGRRGAVGLVQIKPSTARAMAAEADLEWTGDTMLHDPATNIRLGLHYLRKLEKRFGNRYVAIVAYNAGPTRARRVDEPSARRWPYVAKILARWEQLAADSVE